MQHKEKFGNKKGKTKHAPIVRAVSLFDRDEWFCNNCTLNPYSGLIEINWIMNSCPKISYIFLISDVRTSYAVLEPDNKKDVEKPLLGNIIKESDHNGKFYIGR